MSDNATDGTDRRLGPHRVPRIVCKKCGTKHHYDAAGGHCAECSGFLREATDAETRQFADFMDWNYRHLRADSDRSGGIHD